MQQAGTVLHLARSGRLIVKATSQVSDGALLVDGNGRRAGKVMETIGPASSPYLSVQPMTERTDRMVGEILFVSETKEKLGKERFQYKKNKGGHRPHAKSS